MIQEVAIGFLDKVVLAAFVGLFTSGIFLWFLAKFFRPRIDISSMIARGMDTNNGRTIYRIKVINRTRCPIVDIKAQLHIFKNHQTATGEVWKSKAIELKRADPVLIDKYDKADGDVNYAYRFVTYDDLESIWNDNIHFLRFRIYAKHSISGFGGFFYHDFRLKRITIKSGEFSKGDTFEIT